MALVHGCQWLPLVALARLDKGRVRGGEGAQGRWRENERGKEGRRERRREVDRYMDSYGDNITAGRRARRAHY